MNSHWMLQQVGKERNEALRADIDRRRAPAAPHASARLGDGAGAAAIQALWVRLTARLLGGGPGRAPAPQGAPCCPAWRPNVCCS